ncbi:hypothetical protein [Nocardia sp. NPDC056000]|uniref:hypothetical protein n=1 Tax=Nocardia sp. NPDC056000 TaxID=3345674 RepID=UPI0035D74738
MLPPHPELQRRSRRHIPTRLLPIPRLAIPRRARLLSIHLSPGLLSIRFSPGLLPVRFSSSLLPVRLRPSLLPLRHRPLLLPVRLLGIPRRTRLSATCAVVRGSRLRNSPVRLSGRLTGRFPADCARLVGSGPLSIRGRLPLGSGSRSSTAIG